MRELSAAQARRIALASQGFADPLPRGRVDRRHLRRVLDRVRLLQVDSVNVLTRAHELPAYSRLGPYPRALLHGMAYGDRELFEYWGHEASLLPVATQPLLRWRMARAEVAPSPFVAQVESAVAERGPVRASDLADPGERRGRWWGWGDTKRALEALFRAGRVTTAARGPTFERWYDVPERVLPAAVLAAPTPTEDDAHRRLLAAAGRALGVATARDLADYFRLDIRPARARLAELVEEGTLVPARVDAWAEPAFLHAAARCPRRVDAAGLLAPFDPLVWERARTERLFGFRYRIEIYTPAADRRFGYYVLPFLLGDRLVGRVDLKADRRAGVLRVPAAHIEDGEDPRAVVDALVVELKRMGEWLALDRVEAADRGDLAPALRRALG